MKQLITILILSIAALCCAQSQTLSTEILYPIDGSTVRGHGLQVQAQFSADFLPAQDLFYSDGLLIAGGLFYVPSTVISVPWSPTKGTHTLETQVVEIDSFGNYIRSYSSIVTVTVK